MSAELVAWLRGVLDDVEVSALIQSFAPDHASGLPHAVQARVQAERAILAEHKPMHRPVWPARKPPGGGYTVGYYPDQFDCERCSDDDPRAYACPWPCDTVLWLAYGHRFDAPGYDPAWAPEGVSAR